MQGPAGRQKGLVRSGCGKGTLRQVTCKASWLPMQPQASSARRRHSAGQPRPYHCTPSRSATATRFARSSGASTSAVGGSAAHSRSTRTRSASKLSHCRRTGHRAAPRLSRCGAAPVPRYPARQGLCNSLGDAQQPLCLPIEPTSRPPYSKPPNYCRRRLNCRPGPAAAACKESRRDQQPLLLLNR